MSNIKDPLGDRIKGYELQETFRKVVPSLPVIVRADGRAFHTFTRGLDRPFDNGLARLMEEVTKVLVGETNAVLGYTQSDEINLVLVPTDDGDVYFGGRIQKMVSHVAAQASAVFNHLLVSFLPMKAAVCRPDALPTFDARVFAVPSLAEAANAILWREQDAIRNSIQAAAQSAYPHHQLLNKSRNEQLSMLRDAGIVWEDYPMRQKRGTYVTRKQVLSKISPDELDNLPEKHFARTNPDVEIARSVISVTEFPFLRTIANLPQALFEAAPPVPRAVPGAG